MPLLRPEIETFVQAAKTLVERDLLNASLSQDEEIALVQWITMLDEQFFSRGFHGDGCTPPLENPER
jgi:hypothetical protein